MKENFPGTRIAGSLLRQVENRSDACGFWVVSAISKIAGEQPEMTVAELKELVCQNMPRSAVEYAEYCRTT